MALTNVVIGDGQATPVNRTFEVFSPQTGNNEALLLQKSAGITKLAERMSLVTRRSGSGNAYRVIGTIRVPRVVAAATSATPETVDTAVIDFGIVIPDTFTQAMRDDLAAYLKNLVAHATVQTAIKSVTSFA